MLQRVDRILIVRAAVRVHIDPAMLTDDLKIPVHLAEGDLYLLDQDILELPAVLSLDADLSVFDQQRMKIHCLSSLVYLLLYSRSVRNRS